MAGASQVVSSGFKVAAKASVKAGKKVSSGIKVTKNVKILSPDKLYNRINGGTLVKIGKVFRVDVNSEIMLHAHFLGSFVKKTFYTRRQCFRNIWRSKTMKINAYNDKDLIYISLGNLDCSIENTLKILEKFKSNVVVMQIGDVKKEGELFEIIKRVSRKYWLVLLEDKLLADVIFKIDRHDLEEVLREFFKIENRSFSIQIVPDQSIWKPSTLDINTRQLMKSGMITAEIVVVVDESQVDILCCKNSYDKKQLVTYIKEQLG